MLGTDELINYQNQFVSFKGMTVEAAGQDANGNDVPFLYNYDGSGTEGDDLYFNASYNGQTLYFHYRVLSLRQLHRGLFRCEISSDRTDHRYGGFLYWYEGVNPHITSVTVVG